MRVEDDFVGDTFDTPEAPDVEAWDEFFAENDPWVPPTFAAEASELASGFRLVESGEFLFPVETGSGAFRDTDGTQPRAADGEWAKVGGGARLTSPTPVAVITELADEPRRVLGEDFVDNYNALRLSGWVRFRAAHTMRTQYADGKTTPGLDALVDAIDELPTHDLTVYRGLDRRSPWAGRDWKPGEEWTMSAPSSTSLDPNVAAKYTDRDANITGDGNAHPAGTGTVLEIKGPGTSIWGLSGVGMKEIQEVIVPPGRYRVAGVRSGESPTGPVNIVTMERVLTAGETAGMTTAELIQLHLADGKTTKVAATIGAFRDQARRPKGDPHGGEWVDDGVPNQSDIRHDEGFPLKPGFRRVHTAEDRVAVRESHGVVIPPGWSNVQVSIDPHAEGMRARGTDDKGRHVSRYSAEHKVSASASKFQRIKAFEEVKERLVDALREDRLVDPAAGALQVMRRMGLRPGSTADTKAKRKAYGATTLEARHVTFSADGTRATLDFDSKKGGHTRVSTSDPGTVETLRHWTEGKAPGDRVFPTSAAAANRYMAAHTPGFTSKDLRTSFATAYARRLAKRIAIPKTAAATRKAKNAVATKVSNLLGNKPGEALRSYIAPEVWDTAGWVA